MKKLPRFTIHVLVFLATLVILFAAKYIFIVRTIKISGISELRGLSKLSNSSIFLIRSKTLEKEIFKTNPQVSEVTVQKKLPDTILIKVSKSRPVAELSIADGIFLLSSDGRIISKQKSKTHVLNVPELNYYQQLFFNQYATGETLTQRDILASLVLADGLLDRHIEVESIDIMNENMIVLKAKDTEFLFTVKKDTTMQVVELEYILEQLDIQGKEFKKIDLRFSKPVIEY